MELNSLKLLESERKRISEELHDGVLGKLFGIRLNLGLLNQLNTFDKNFDKLLAELQKVEKDIRNVSHKLGANIPEINNFNNSLLELLNSSSLVGKFEYEIDISKDINWETLSIQKIINFYRVLQELLVNIIKHSKAKKVSLNICKLDSCLNISLIDDGVGFDDKTIQNNGIGLRNIFSRVSNIGAKIDINSGLESGTKIELVIPYD